MSILQRVTKRKEIPLEWVKNILGDVYTEEMEQKIAEEIGKGYVSRADFEAKDTEATTLKEQLKEANKAMEGFKDLDVQALQQEVEDWKQKARQAEKDAASQVAAIRFEARLEAAIAKAGGRNATAIKALLDLEGLQASDQPEQAVERALEQLCQEQGYLFEGAKPLPYAAGTGVGSLPSSDTVLRSAFGLARETE